MQLAWKVDEGSKVRLKDYDSNFVDKYTDRALAAVEIEKLSEELGEMQQLLAAARHHSLLIVLQGMDTSGKDGTNRDLLVARTLVSTLRPYKDAWEAQLVKRGERELALLAQLGHLGQTGDRENKRTKKARKALYPDQK